jgi:hypothetical protein
VYSKGTKKGRGVQEKEERVSITIYLEKKVWNEFQKFIAPRGRPKAQKMRRESYGSLIPYAPFLVAL